MYRLLVVFVVFIPFVAPSPQDYRSRSVIDVVKGIANKSPTSGNCISKCPWFQIYKFLPHDDCNKYCVCFSKLRLIVECEKGAHFSAKHDMCVDPSESECGKVNGCLGQCPHESLNTYVSLAHEDCNKFCRCKKGRPIVEDCGPNYQFNLERQLCLPQEDAGCNRLNGHISTTTPSEPSTTLSPPTTKLPNSPSTTVQPTTTSSPSTTSVPPTSSTSPTGYPTTTSSPSTSAEPSTTSGSSSTTDPATTPSSLPVVDPSTTSKPLPTADPVTTSGPSSTTDPATASSSLPIVDPTTTPSSLPVVDPSTTSKPLPTADPVTTSGPSSSTDPATASSSLPIVDPTTTPSSLPVVDPSTTSKPLPTADPVTTSGPSSTTDPATSSSLPVVDPSTTSKPLPTADPVTTSGPSSSTDTATSSSLPAVDPSTTSKPLPTAEPATTSSSLPTVNPSPTPSSSGSAVLSSSTVKNVQRSLEPSLSYNPQPSNAFTSEFTAPQVIKTPSDRSVPSCAGHCPPSDDPDSIVILAHKDCTKYCRCKQGHPIVKSCPPNYHFSFEQEMCLPSNSTNCHHHSNHSG